MAEEEIKEIFDGRTSGDLGVPKFPVTVDGWAKRLVEEYDLKQIKEILMLHHSGMLTVAVSKALEVTEKMPFDAFWEVYAYKKGSKGNAKKTWDKLSFEKQKMIVNVAVPRYNRYIDISGIAKCQPVVYLRQRRYLDEIPTPDQITKFAKTVERFFDEYLQWKKKYPSYQREAFETLFKATEAFMYRFPNMEPIHVCGVLKWMVKSWESQYRHLIRPSRAMNLMKWQNYYTSASFEIDQLKNERDRRRGSRIERSERDVERGIRSEEE
jgi:hypothetical protein